MKVIKKDNTVVSFDKTKIINAINKSAERVLVELTEKEKEKVCEYVLEMCKGTPEIKVSKIHQLVEKGLDNVNSEVARSYREYRNYKRDFVSMLDDVYLKAQKIMYLGDKENSNTDSTLVSTKRSLIYNELNKELYKKFFLNIEEKQACKDGYIYIHDTSARRDTLENFGA